jgi:hypothetical protein
MSIAGQLITMAIISSVRGSHTVSAAFSDVAALQFEAHQRLFLQVQLTY